MTTSLYFHAASSGAIGTLPSTSQTSFVTATGSIDAQTLNRSMNTTIGTSQTTLTNGITPSNNPSNIYISRFVSDPLDSSSTSISANTWTLNWAASSNNTTSAFWPGGSSGGGKIPFILYVWRPSGGGSLVGMIFNNRSTTKTSLFNNNSEKGSVVTATGSAITAATGDLIVLELWAVSGTVGSSITYNAFIDGTNNSIVDTTAISSAASNISTPQTLTFTSTGGPVTCTVSGNTIIPNKLVTLH